MKRLVAAELDDLKRVGNTLETIKDCLVLSSPDRIPYLLQSPNLRRLLRWAVSTEILRPGAVTKQWKLFAGHIKWRLLESESPPPELPTDFPGYSRMQHPSGLPRFWKELLPWLERLFTKGLRTKRAAARVLHLVSTRGFPPADQAERQRAILDHADTLFTAPTPDPERGAMLQEICYQLGRLIRTRYIQPNREPNLAHTSLTSSASFDSPVKLGGRATEVVEKFRAWRHEEPDQDLDKMTWFGTPYVLRKGVARWRTLGRSADNIYTSEGEPGESSHELVINPDGTIRFYEDPIHALDGYTGYQLVLWAIEELLSQGILEGSPYHDPANPLKMGTARPNIRASAIGEPGWKARIVTVTDAAITILLQPMSHFLSGFLSRHPAARAGLKRGWQLYEYVKEMTWKNGALDEGEEPYWLSSDLKTATDFCRHDFSQSMLLGFLEGIGHLTHFTSVCSALLCSSRRYMTDIEPFYGLNTRRGILMGDPGTKMVLTLHNLCAEAEAALRYQFRMERASCRRVHGYVRRMGLKALTAGNWRHFACAGDDHIAYGPKSYLRMITKAHSENGMCVSWPKNYLSKRGAFYCEEMLLVTAENRATLWGVKLPLSQRKYETHPHVDALKTRIFSPCAKECDVKDDTNHAIGKARSAVGMIQWLGGGFEPFRPFFSYWWERRMRAYLPDQEHYRFLPTFLGGVGVPGLHLTEEEVKVFLERSPEGLKRAWISLLKGEIPPVVKRLIETFSVSARVRGLEANQVEDQIREVLSSPEITQAKELSTLRPDGFDPLRWENLRQDQKIDVVKSQCGLIPISECLKILDRVYTFRDILYPEISIRHGYNPCRKTRNYENVPWSRRIRHFEERLKEVNQMLSEKTNLETEWESTRDKISTLIRTGADLKIPRTIFLIERSFLETERLCTLQLPDFHKVKIPPC